MPTHLRQFGDEGEELAAKFLEQKEYKILERNFLVREGEIDLIAEQDDEIVFVEVKTRRGKTFGAITESLTQKKEEKLFLAIEKYLELHQKEDSMWRVDVITVDYSCRPPYLEHFENAFS